MAQKDDNKKPGGGALQNMQLLKKESSLFKVPKVPPKKKIVKKTKIEIYSSYHDWCKVGQRHIYYKRDTTRFISHI